MPGHRDLVASAASGKGKGKGRDAAVASIETSTISGRMPIPGIDRPQTPPLKTVYPRVLNTDSPKEPPKTVFPRILNTESSKEPPRIVYPNILNTELLRERTSIRECSQGHAAYARDINTNLSPVRSAMPSGSEVASAGRGAPVAATSSNQVWFCCKCVCRIEHNSPAEFCLGTNRQKCASVVDTRCVGHASNRRGQRQNQCGISI
jgi:hypothetical protein